jgi:glucokinase
VTAVAVDVGGSGVRAAAADERAGTRGEVARAPLEARLDRGEILDRIGDVVRGVSGDEIAAVALAIPSFVRADGTVTDCPSLPALAGVHLAEALRERLGAASIAVLPDLAAAAIGESRLGSGRGVSRFLCVALGTGANAAAVVDGELVETAYGCLGDAGHVLVEPDGPPCPCGGRGCLEAVASGYALARDGAPLGLPDGRSVVEAARAGRRDAAALVERAGTALGRAVATWSALLWPQRVAVAGGLAAAGDLLLEPARLELARVGVPYIVSEVELVPAELGADATLAGAGITAAALTR